MSGEEDEVAEASPETAEEPTEEETAEGLQRRSLDPEIANVLREEAAREAAARMAEAEGLETQPDLGLDDAGDDAAKAADRSAAARARMARLRGQEEGGEAEGQAAMPIPPGSRKELLPDVEEINSSLRSAEDREPVATPDPEADGLQEAQPEARGGGRWAFRLIVLLAIAAMVVYLLAPQIVAMVPQAEPYMIAYVEFVNGLRAQVDPLVSNAVAQIKGLFASLTGG